MKTKETTFHVLQVAAPLFMSAASFKAFLFFRCPAESSYILNYFLLSHVFGVFKDQTPLLQKHGSEHYTEFQIPHQANDSMNGCYLFQSKTGRVLRFSQRTRLILHCNFFYQAHYSKTRFTNFCHSCFCVKKYIEGNSKNLSSFGFSGASASIIDYKSTIF